MYTPYCPAFQAHFDPVGMSERIRQDLGDDSLCHVSSPLVLLQQDFNTQSWPDVSTPRSIHSPHLLGRPFKGRHPDQLTLNQWVVFSTLESPKSTTISRNCSSAASRSSTISWAMTSGSGRLSDASRMAILKADARTAPWSFMHRKNQRCPPRCPQSFETIADGVIN